MTAEVTSDFAHSPDPIPTASTPNRISDFRAWCLTLLPLASTAVEAAAQWMGHELDANAVNLGVSCALLITAFKEAKTIERVGANPKGIHLRWWSLVTPVYLIQRARALGRGWIFPIILVLSFAPMIILVSPELLKGNLYFSLPRCDDQKMKENLIEIADKSYKSKNIALTMTGVDMVTEQSVTDKVRTCSATAHFSDGEVLPIVFTINDQGGDYWIYIKKVGSSP